MDDAVSGGEWEEAHPGPSKPRSKAPTTTANRQARTCRRREGFPGLPRLALEAEHLRRVLHGQVPHLLQQLVPRHRGPARPARRVVRLPVPLALALPLLAVVVIVPQQGPVEDLPVAELGQLVAALLLCLHRLAVQLLA